MMRLSTVSPLESARQRLRTISARAGNTNAPYSPVLSFALLLGLALAVTISH